ncbi:MAG: HAMP domain-containing histidine kinase [Clostridia bacterium]|nr:HAMP domain-containing histidine kinase [Clostridia bacterium]
MRQRIFNKYFLITASAILFSLSVMMVILTVIFNDYLSDMKYETLKKSCDSVANFTYNGLDSGEIEEEIPYFIAKNISDVSDVDVFFLDENGVVRICSDSGVERNCEHIGIEVPENFLLNTADGTQTGFGNLNIYGEDHYYAVRILGDTADRFIGYVVSASSIADVDVLMSRMSRLYLIAAIVPLSIMFIAIYVITYRMTKPLKQMSDAAKAMARGDFSRRIPVTSDDEIGRLAVSFNQMTNSLSRLEEMRKSFVADISHELKTPMTTIGGFIDGIIDGTIEPERQKHYLEIVSEEVGRLSRMVQSMLSISQLESGTFTLKTEKFDFKELLLSVVLSQEQRIDSRGLKISGLDTVQSITLNADKDLIYRVVYNLVDNAVKFTDDGGSIDFSVKVEARKLVFNIRNTGKGIPENDLPYLFERFYKVDKSRSANKKSTGLGLFIVKTIVKNHGGKISVSSVENEFTSFEVILPLG